VTFKHCQQPADVTPVSSRRWSARLQAILILASLVTAGCGYDEGEELPGIVARATPAGAKLVGECGGSPGLIESPSRECTYTVAGEAGDVTNAVADALVAVGFDVSCRRDENTIRITALRANVRVDAHVIEDDSLTNHGDGAVNVHGRGYVPTGARRIPAGSVALSVNASRQSEASADFHREWIADGFACSAIVLHAQTLEGCVEAWNSHANERNQRLVVRRMRVPAAYVRLRSDEPGVSSGCFFGVLARQGRYLIFESTWKNGSAAFARPELGYASGKGFDANARVRGDGTFHLKPSNLNDRCEVWWNAPAGWDLRRLALARQLVADVYAVYSEGRTTSCVYLLRTGGRYLRAVLTFEDGNWRSPGLIPVKRPRRFHPNGELHASGLIAVGP
jgi:hypothetical protein